MSYYFIILYCCWLIVPHPIEASFFKQATSWFFGTHQYHIFKEISCANDSTLLIENSDGPITIQSWSLETIAAEIIVTTNKDQLADTVVSLQQTPSFIRLAIVEDQLPLSCEVTCSLRVPRHTHIIVKNKSGLITIKQCSTTISAISERGSITLLETSGSVFAHAYGTINALVKSLNSTDSYECISQQGNIYMALPSSAAATLNASCQTGMVHSQQKITLNPVIMKLDSESWQWAKRNVRGTIGCGGAPIFLQSYGPIYITGQ